MDTKQAEGLMQKYLDETASPEERAIFESWYNQTVHDNLSPVNEPDYEALELRLAKSLPAGGRKVYKLWSQPAPNWIRRIAVAAAAVAAIVFGVWFFNSERGVLKQVQDDVAYKNDIAPGKNGATITLANGKVIQLSDAKSGVVVGNGRITYSSSLRAGEVSKQSHDEIASIPRDDGRAQALIAATARGQTYQFTLSDGTKVWLNADSKLEFPSNFVNNKTRNVKLSGEAYFEVAKDKAHPFIVATDKQEVEVLGTHFNINAYKDESNIRTTLLEGSVRVNEVILKPNQQSVLSGSNRIAVKEVDTEDVMAWKSGLFVFENEQLESIMRKIGRWYNVTVAYDDPEIASQTFTGTVTRFGKISIVLKRLEVTGNVKFKLEGNKIFVSKKN